jgi:hypothetical protein
LADDATFLSRAFKANRIKTPIHIVKDGDETIAYLEGSGARNALIAAGVLRMISTKINSTQNAL